MANSSKIHFFFQGVKISLPHRTRLKAFITKLFAKEGKKLKSLNYIFTSDKDLLRINREYLDHDFYTDIITFDLSEDPDFKVAEIYISTDRVRENAVSFGVAIQQELLRVIFHGALHLCGYKDKSHKDKELMTFKENYFLKLYTKESFT
jgi:rRNA maturation RNase YbeY